MIYKNMLKIPHVCILFVCSIIVRTNSIIYGAHSNQIDKVSFTQKGYIQFLRYITEVPPIEDFTFCIWLRSNNLTFSHPLLSYSKHESERLIRAWVSPKGADIILAVRLKEIFRVPVDLRENHWYHICQSWSSRTGHWDLYLNGKLKAHGTSEKGRGQVLPRDGDIVVGQEYTDFDKGLDDGIEGDIFGFNMVLSSVSIEPSQKLSNNPFRYNRRRISHVERPKSGYMVQSPVLFLRRPKAIAILNTNEETKQNYTAESSELEDIYDNSSAINDQEELEKSNDDLNSDNDEKQFESSEFDKISTRKTRQNNDFYPISYVAFTDFNFTPKPFNRPFRYYQPKSAPQYSIRDTYLPETSIPPISKINRIANDIPPSVVMQKSLGMQLIELSYNCMLGRGAPLKNVLVSWTKTPVRVFGGAILKKGDPFCL